MVFQAQASVFATRTSGRGDCQGSRPFEATTQTSKRHCQASGGMTRPEPAHLIDKRTLTVKTTDQAIAFEPEAFDVLSELEQNNNRDGFKANKDRFDHRLVQPFIDLLETLGARLDDAPLPLSGGKATVFRMNRDVRFSKDKSPYKTNLSGVLTPSGTKKEMGGIVYIQMDAKGGFAAAGFYNLGPAQLGPIRDAMIAREDDFAAVTAELGKAGRSLEGSDCLTTTPRGYADDADHPHAADLRLKSLIVHESFARTTGLSGAVADGVERLARDAMPRLTVAGSGR